MTGTLYTVSKKPNSTALPGGTGTPVSFVLKGACSVQAPVFTMKERPAGNYLHVPSFSRYYWITDITYELGEWAVSCVCDVLATYKTEIGASTQYVTRSASAYDGEVLDRLYPTKSVPDCRITQAASGLDMDGVFVVGIAGQPVVNAKVYGLTYYVFTPSQMRGFLTALFTASNLEQWALDTTTGLESAIQSIMQRLSALPDDMMAYFFDAFQYVRSCVWLPIKTTDFFQLVGVTGVYMGVAGFSAPCYQIVGNPMNINSSLTVPSHPQAGTRGSFLNCSPFSHHVLYVPGVGDVPLPSGEVRGGDTINVSMEVSVTDGSVIADITATRTGYSSNIGHYTGHVGTSIPLSVTASNVPGAALQLAGAVGSAFAGDALGAASGVIGAAQTQAPKVSTIGGQSGFHPIMEQNIILASTFWEVVDEDLASHGRPLCQPRQLSTLSGYILCENAEISTSGTRAENEEIMNYLNGGFYYE